MKPPLPTALFLLSVCGIAAADNIVTFVQGPTPPATSRAYLASAPIDNAYVYVVANFSNPGDVQCVSPINSDSAAGLFIRSNVDLGIAVQPLGFFGIDPKSEIPLATYAYSSDKQYCKSSWRLPIVVVPPTPFGKSPPGYNLIDEPSLVVQFRSSAQPTLSVIEPMQALIGIAGGLATGGAANTVVGISKIASGPAVDFLNKEFEKRRKTVADGTLQFKLTWNEIAGGLGRKSFSLINGNRGWRESADAAIARIRANPSAPENKVILTVDFDIRTRRSMFVQDNELGANQLPAAALTDDKYYILNFPNLVLAPSIYQRINVEAPSIIQGLKEKGLNACDKLLVTIRDLGFNKLDRAIVAGAVLDDATPGWRADSGFYTACFRSEPAIPATLASIKTGYFPVPPPPPPTFVELERAINLGGEWPESLTAYLSKARLGFYSKGEARVNAMAMSDAVKSIVVAGLAGTDKLLTKEQADNPNLPLDDLIKGLQPDRIGCFFGFKVAADATWRAAMIVTLKERNGNIEPYLFQATFPNGATAENKPAPSYIEIMPILSPMASNSAAWFNSAQFNKNSLCNRPGGADGYAVLQSLRAAATN